MSKNHILHIDINRLGSVSKIELDEIQIPARSVEISADAGGIPVLKIEIVFTQRKEFKMVVDMIDTDQDDFDPNKAV